MTALRASPIGQCLRGFIRLRGPRRKKLVCAYLVECRPFDSAQRSPSSPCKSSRKMNGIWTTLPTRFCVTLRVPPLIPMTVREGLVARSIKMVEFHVLFKLILPQHRLVQPPRPALGRVALTAFLVSVNTVLVRLEAVILPSCQLTAEVLTAPIPTSLQRN